MKEQMNNTSCVFKALLSLSIFLLPLFSEQAIAEPSPKIEATAPEMKVLSLQKQRWVEVIAQKIVKAHQNSDSEQKGYSYEKAIFLWNEISNEINNIDDDKSTMRGLLSLRIDGLSLLMYLLPYPQCEPEINSMRDRIMMEMLKSSIALDFFSSIFSAEKKVENERYLVNLLKSPADGKRNNLWYILASVAPSTCGLLGYELYRLPSIIDACFVQEKQKTTYTSDTIKGYSDIKDLSVAELFYTLVTNFSNSMYNPELRERFPKYKKEEFQETLVLLDEKFTSVFEELDDKQLLTITLINQKDWKSIITKGSVNSRFFNAVIKAATQELSPEVRSLSPEIQNKIQKIAYETVQATTISNTQNKKYSYEQALIMWGNIQKEIKKIENNPQAVRALLSIQRFEDHYSFLLWLLPNKFYEPKINSINDDIIATLLSSEFSEKNTDNEEYLSKLLTSPIRDRDTKSHLWLVLSKLAPSTIDCLGKMFCKYPNLIKTCLEGTEGRDNQRSVLKVFYNSFLSFTGVKYDSELIDNTPKYQINNTREMITKLDNDLALAFSKLEDKKEVAKNLVGLWQLTPDFLANPHSAYFKAVLDAAEIKVGK